MELTMLLWAADPSPVLRLERHRLHPVLSAKDPGAGPCCLLPLQGAASRETRIYEDLLLLSLG